MIIKNKSDYDDYAKQMRRHPEFSPLDDKYVHQLLDEMKVKQYHRGQILFDQGDTRDKFYFLIEGVAKSFHWDKNGDEQLYLYIRPNKGFPYIGLFEDDRYAYTVQTMTDVKIAEFSMPIYEQVLRENPELMVNAVKEMSQIINTSETQLQRMVTTSARCRVANAILFIGQQIGDLQEDDTILIPYPITIVELSKVSGTTRETTSQMVQKLVSENKIQYNRKYFKILELDEDSY